VRYHKKKTVKISSICCALFAFLCAEIIWAKDYQGDIDADGILDTIVVTKSKTPDDEVTLNLQIVFSSNAKTVNRTETLDSIDASHFTVYLWRNTPGVLVLDYTNRSTRQASDFRYEVYKWTRSLNKLCLHSTYHGTPPDQLADETHDSTRFVRFYNSCTGLDETTPSLNVSDEDYYRIGAIFTTISDKKAKLYNSPNDNDKSKMYLVFGDKIKVKGYRYIKNSGTDWFFIEYQPDGKPVSIKKWIRGESVEPR
jgi:hypothetical protein